MSKHFLQAEQRSAATCWDMLTYLNILLIILLDQLSATYAALASSRAPSESLCFSSRHLKGLNLVFLDSKLGA